MTSLNFTKMRNSNLEETRDFVQGYYGLLSNFYFTGGLSTATVISTEEVGQWLDVNLTVDPQGLFDQRTTNMSQANVLGHTGAGTQADPIIFLLEGLETSSTANVRASFSFDPDADGGRLDTRLCFNRHSGATPSEDFHIEGSSIPMESGAEEDYAASPSIQFFLNSSSGA